MSMTLLRGFKEGADGPNFLCVLTCDADPEHPCIAMLNVHKVACAAIDKRAYDTVNSRAARGAAEAEAALLGWHVEVVEGLKHKHYCPAHWATIRSARAFMADPERVAEVKQRIAELDEKYGQVSEPPSERTTEESFAYAVDGIMEALVDAGFRNVSTSATVADRYGELSFYDDEAARLLRVITLGLRRTRTGPIARQQPVGVRPEEMMAWLESEEESP